ncbi:MAG: zinc ribbon domain-containing protein [Chitinispirillaceae bacterium]
MPMHKPEDFGTEANGIRNNDYCNYCYRDGAFTNPDLTMNEMMDFCTNTMAEQGIMPREQAAALMKEALPNLKWWR